MTENKQFRIINEYGDYHLLNGNKKLGYDLCSPSMMKENWNNVVDELNNQDARIKELESEKEFWRYNCIHESNRNSILRFELDFAKEQGYEWSDAFKEYENSVKENNEWNKKYISEKGSGDVE